MESRAIRAHATAVLLWRCFRLRAAWPDRIRSCVRYPRAQGRYIRLCRIDGTIPPFPGTLGHPGRMVQLFPNLEAREIHLRHEPVSWGLIHFWVTRVPS